MVASNASQRWFEKQMKDPEFKANFEKASKDIANSMNLNPGIQRTVGWLNLNNFTTIDSGDGETHDFECDRKSPYVYISVDKDKAIEESDRLMHLINDEFSLHIQPMGMANEPSIQMGYDPADQSAIISLEFVNDKLLFGDK